MKIKDIADYCLKCKNPTCIKYCPANNNIPQIMKFISQEQYHEAYRELLKTQILPEYCGLLCAHDHQCEGHCIRGIKGNPVDIGQVEYLLSTMYKGSFLNDLQTPSINTPGKTVAVVGAGVTGITSSIILAKAGFKVTIFEKGTQIGGTIDKYIPSFRFNLDTSTHLLSILKELKVLIVFEKVLGVNLGTSELAQYDYQVIATGAQIPSGIGFENISNCYYGLNILEDYKNNRCNINNKNIIVIGAGNVAMDVARSLKRLNNNVTIVYRRTLDNSPASKKEINDAINEKIQIAELWAPIKPVLQENVLIGMQAQKMQLIPNNEGTRKNVIPVEGAISFFPCDIIVSATGATSDYEWLKEDKYPIFDENGWINVTNYKTYHFGGDYLTGPSNIVKAMKSGRDIAYSIINKTNNLENIKQMIKASKKSVMFGGSFNPPTLAHKAIIDVLVNELNVNLLLLPNGDSYHFYDKELLNFRHRYNMLKLLTKNFENIQILKDEENQEFMGTIQTLKTYKHPFFVIGTDSLATITSWKDAKKLIKQNKFLVFNRIGFDFAKIINDNEILSLYKDHFIYLDYNVGNISSTNFRISHDKNMITEEVADYIISNNLYQEEKNV